jgi:hypothetical protein
VTDLCSGIGFLSRLFTFGHFVTVSGVKPRRKKANNSRWLRKEKNTAFSSSGFHQYVARVTDDISLRKIITLLEEH